MSAAAALLGSALVVPQPALAAPTAPSVNWLRSPQNIAHALGGLTVTNSSGNDEIYTYTNCKEAFEQNYAKGYRVFEFDLTFTSDWRLVARHDWSSSLYSELGETDPGFVPTHDQFMNIQPFGKYTPLDIEGVVALMKKYPDCTFITDTKYNDKSRVTKGFDQIISVMGSDAPALTQRLVVQIYTEQMLSYVQAVYPFPNVIYTLYHQPTTTAANSRAVWFAHRHNLAAVTMDTTRYSNWLASLTRSDGMAPLVNTVDSQSAAASYYSHGVRLLYSNALPAHPLRASPLVALFQIPIAPDAKPFDPKDD